jgi:hypothetical protein
MTFVSALSSSTVATTAQIFQGLEKTNDLEAGGRRPYSQASSRPDMKVRGFGVRNFKSFRACVEGCSTNNVDSNTSPSRTQFLLCQQRLLLCIRWRYAFTKSCESFHRRIHTHRRSYLACECEDCLDQLLRFAEPLQRHVTDISVRKPVFPYCSSGPINFRCVGTRQR